MKPGIHPKYAESVVTCACGATWTTQSTRPQLRTDVCSQCHPFYTGEQRIVDTAGRVERFMTRMQRAVPAGTTQQRPAAPAKQPVKAARPAPRPAVPPATLENLLETNPEQ